MAKQRVSINGITKWKEIEETPRQVAPVVEEAKVVPLRQAIGEVLRDVRQRQGRTLREVSQRARVSLGYLSEVERGQKAASSELLAWICQALDIPMSQMLREVADRMAVLEGVQIPDTVPAEMSEQYTAFPPNTTHRKNLKPLRLIQFFPSPVRRRIHCLFNV